MVSSCGPMKQNMFANLGAAVEFFPNTSYARFYAPIHLVYGCQCQGPWGVLAQEVNGHEVVVTDQQCFTWLQL